MKKALLTTLSLLLCGLSHGAPTAEQILAKSDEIRNPQLDYTVMVKITSYKPKQNPSVSTFKSLVKGRDQSVVITQTPKIDRGRVLLMNGNNFWGYLPNVSKPLRISLQERLVGEVSNGDLARANFSGDYTPTISKNEVIDGKKTVVLELKANTEDVTYGRVMLWVEQANNRPVKADFYAFSGRLLKTCTYGGYKQMAGMMRPAQQVMRDAVNTAQYSELEYNDVTVAPLPDKYFTKDYMKTFQTE